MNRSKDWNINRRLKHRNEAKNGNLTKLQNQDEKGFEFFGEVCGFYGDIFLENKVDFFLFKVSLLNIRTVCK